MYGIQYDEQLGLVSHIVKLAAVQEVEDKDLLYNKNFSMDLFTVFW